MAMTAAQCTSASIAECVARAHDSAVEVGPSPDAYCAQLNQRGQAISSYVCAFEVCV